MQNECRWWTLPFDIIVGGGSHKGCSVTPHPSLQGPPGGNLPTIPLSFFPSLFKFFDEQGLGCMARKDWRNPFVSYWCPNLLASLNNIPTPNSFCPIFWISESESFEMFANAPKQSMGKSDFKLMAGRWKRKKGWQGWQGTRSPWKDSIVKDRCSLVLVVGLRKKYLAAHFLTAAKRQRWVFSLSFPPPRPSFCLALLTPADVLHHHLPPHQRFVDQHQESLYPCG